MTTEYINEVIQGAQNIIDDIEFRLKNYVQPLEQRADMVSTKTNLESHIAYLKQHENYKG